MCGRGELAEVGADGGSAAVAGKVGAFGIDQHRNRQLAGGLNHKLADPWGEHSLGVIGKHNGMAAGQVRKHGGYQAIVVGPWTRAQALAVKAQHLLPAAQNAELGDGGKAP